MERDFTVVSSGKRRQGRLAGLGGNSLNYCSRLWGNGTVFSFLVPSPGMIRTEGHRNIIRVK